MDLLNCIDKDGTNAGFDIELINAVRSTVTIPVIASSGAGCAEHSFEIFTQTKTEAPLAAGIFHSKEVPIGEVKDCLKDKIEIRPVCFWSTAGPGVGCLTLAQGCEQLGPGEILLNYRFSTFHISRNQIVAKDRR